MSAPVLHLLGDGVTTQFDVTFSFYNPSDAEVYVGIDGKDLNIDYTLIGDSATTVEGNGKINFFTAPADGAKITIVRNTLNKRLTDFESAAYFQEKLLDGEFNNYLRMLEDMNQLLDATPHFHPLDYGKLDGVLPPSIPRGILQVNDTGDGFIFVELDNVPEFVAVLDSATKARDRAEIAAVSATGSQAAAALHQHNAESAYLGSEEAADRSEGALASSKTQVTKASQYATFPYGLTIPNTTDKSALHYAEQARINANQAFESGGTFTPSVGAEYPDVAGIVRDTIWLVKLPASVLSYTFTGGGLAGKTVKSSDQIFYDTPNNTFELITIPNAGATLVALTNLLKSQVGNVVERNPEALLDDNHLPMTGDLYLRSDYPELFNKMNGTPQMITEAVWQSKATSSHGGAVSLYSDGDGSTTFRVPSVGTESLFTRVAGVNKPLAEGDVSKGYEDQLKSHEHTLVSPGPKSSQLSADNHLAVFSAGSYTLGGSNSTPVLGISGSAGEAQETRPEYMYCSKFIFAGVKGGF